MGGTTCGLQIGLGQAQRMPSNLGKVPAVEGNMVEVFDGPGPATTVQELQGGR